MSATSDPEQAIHELFRKHVPEIAAVTVEIVSPARPAGRRTCVAVRSRAPNISAVQACSGERSMRLKAMTAELGREHFSVFLWHDSPEQLIKNAFLDPTSQVVTDANARRAVVMVNGTARKFANRGGADPLIGVEREMIDLVSSMTGFAISLVVMEKD